MKTQMTLKQAYTGQPNATTYGDPLSRYLLQIYLQFRRSLLPPQSRYQPIQDAALLTSSQALSFFEPRVNILQTMVHCIRIALLG